MTKKINLLEGVSPYRTSLMGIAIIWIMLFHSGIEAPDNIVMRTLWYLFVSFGGGCGVDLFFILSGFGLVYSASKLSSQKQWMGWEKKRLVRILPSYLIVAVIYYLIIGNFSLYNLCQLNFLIDGVRDFWFIPAIIICYLAFPFIFELCEKYGARWTCGLSTILVLAGSIALAYFCPDYFRKAEIFILRIPCFLMGIYLGYLSITNSNKEYVIANAVSLTLCACVFVFKFPGSDRWMFTFGMLPFIQLLIVMLSLDGGGV